MYFFRSDSTLGLQYVRDERHCFIVYLANRVMEVLEMTTAPQWNYTGNEENSADICSRRVATVHDLSNDIGSSKCWYKRWNFLWSNSKVEAKLKESKVEDLNENHKEIKTKCCFINNICNVKFFIQFRIYSSWKRLCHILIYVKRFIKNYKTEGNK